MTGSELCTIIDGKCTGTWGSNGENRSGLLQEWKAPGKRLFSKVEGWVPKIQQNNSVPLYYRLTLILQLVLGVIFILNVLLENPRCSCWTDKAINIKAILLVTSLIHLGQALKHVKSIFDIPVSSVVPNSSELHQFKSRRIKACTTGGNVIQAVFYLHTDVLPLLEASEL